MDTEESKLGCIISGRKYKNNTTYGMITQIKTISKKRILLNDKKYICDESILKKINIAIANYLIKN